LKVIPVASGDGISFGTPALPINPAIAYIALYVAMYAAFGVASPFWPRFFETKGLTAEQIGLILAASMLVRLAVGPLAGRLADLSGSLRLVLALCAMAAAGFATAFLLANTIWLLLAIAMLQAAALAPTTSVADALAGRRLDYGWIRGSASVAFVVGTLVIGQLISGSDLRPIIWLNVALLLAAAAATTLVPAAAPQDAAPLAAREVRGLLRIARFRTVLVVSALIYGSHALHDGFAVIRWSAAGIGPPDISLLWSEAVAAEVAVFFLVGPALLDRIGPRGAAALAAAAGIVRWSIAGLTNSVLVLALVQPLHGLTFALLHLACMRIMSAVVPIPLSATAQAIYAFGSGVVSAGLTALSGTLYAAYGGLSFLAMALLCVVAFPFAWYGLGGREGSEPPGA
jgi:MFS transporter, PPP family, 3-phenylpropionic acid transporter